MPEGSVFRALASPGRAATPAPSSWGQKGGRCCVSARGRTLDVLQGRGTVPAPSPPRLASGATAVEPEGGRKRPPDPEGHQAAPISQAICRRPASQSVRPGAESAAASGGPLGLALGRRRPFPPHRGTCTARLRKVPASAASFFTLKSMMFILGGSRAELPADLAGRRRGRAGAPGESGGGRRGRWREAAPAPPPQLSFP